MVRLNADMWQRCGLSKRWAKLQTFSKSNEQLSGTNALEDEPGLPLPYTENDT